MKKWLLPCLLLIGCLESGPEIKLYNQRGYVCSGVVVNQGRILTAAHCTAGPLFYAGRRIESKPIQVGVDAAELLAPWAEGQVEWGLAAQIGDRMEIVSYGCSKGLMAHRQFGKVTDVSWDVVYTDIPGCIGDSGSPVYDSKHRLIGLVTYLDKITKHLVARRVWP